MLVETLRLTIEYRGAVEIVYTRFFEDDSGQTHTVKNTVGAVACALKLLDDFKDDRVSGYGDC